MLTSRKLRVLIVDDSALVRRALSEAISAAADMEVIGTAADPFEARERLLALHPDVMTLDLEMPKMGGLSFLRQLMQHHPLPVIVISSLTGPACEASLEALRLGAVDVMAKPNGSYSVGQVARDLPAKLRAAGQAQLRAMRHPGMHDSLPRRDARLQKQAVHGRRPVEDSHVDVILALGASTGGTEALTHLLAELPTSIPATVITQHIPPGFSLAFAQRLNRVCEIDVKEAEDGDKLQRGLALVAPGNRHMVVRQRGREACVQLLDGPEVCYQRPSVDVLFESVARAAGANAIGCLLTGMGSDGAAGLLRMRLAGAATFAQDEESSVVFGMPKAAIEKKAVEQVVPLHEMGGELLKAIDRKQRQFRSGSNSGAPNAP